MKPGDQTTEEAEVEETEVEETEVEETAVEDEESTDETPKGWQKRVNRLTGKVKERDERIAELETENARLQDTYDGAQLEAAKSMGVHPKFVSADEAKVIKQADEAQAYIYSLEDAIDDAIEEDHYTDSKGRKWSPKELRAELRAAKSESGRAIDRAGRIRSRAIDEQEKVLSGGSVPRAKKPLSKGAKSKAGKPPAVPGAQNRSTGAPASAGVSETPTMDHAAIRSSKSPKVELLNQIKRRRGVAV